MTQESTGAIVLSPRLVATGDPAGEALENLNTDVLGDGAICYVSNGAGQGEWQLQKESTSAPNGTTVVAPIAGPGRWFLKLPPGAASGGLVPPFPYTDLEQTGPNLEITEPSGWPVTGQPNDVNVTMSYDEATRTFSLTHLNDYAIWSEGARFVKTASESAVWANTSGSHYMYFDQNGDLQTTQLLSVWLDVIGGRGCPVAELTWNATAGGVVALFDERHGFMPGQTHKWAHEALGAKWVRGGALTGFTLGMGDAEADSQLSAESVIFRDEDLRFTVEPGSPQAQAFSPLTCRTIFKIGTEWTYKDPDAYPVLQGGATYLGGAVAAGRLRYNDVSGGTGLLSEVDDGAYVLSHIGVTGEASGFSPDGGSTNWRLFAVVGQAQYANLNAARAGATQELNQLNLEDLPVPEIVWLGTVIYQTQSSYTNSTLSRVVPSADPLGNLVDYVDWRTESVAGPGGSGGSAGGGAQTFELGSASGNQFMSNNTPFGRLYAMAVVPASSFVLTDLTFLVAQNIAGGTGGVGCYNSAGVRLAYSPLQAFVLGLNTIELINGGPVALTGGALYYFCLESNINSCGPMSIQGSSPYNPPVGPNVPPMAFSVPNSRSVDPSGFPANVSGFFGQLGDARKYWLLGN
jgi:hypothetical protein